MIFSMMKGRLSMLRLPPSMNIVNGEEDYSVGALPTNSTTSWTRKTFRSREKTLSNKITRALAIESTPEITAGSPTMRPVQFYNQILERTSQSSEEWDELLRLFLLAIYYTFPREGIPELI